MSQHKTNKNPWPTKAAMQQIYDLNLWGENGSVFYSGDGSHLSEFVNPYLQVVIDFLSSFKEPLTVCDLGCGDFNIGKELVKYSKYYVAVDIVPQLISHNKEVFSKENLSFECIDIANDDLPAGDCALIRQVLQHLSNEEVKRVVDKLKKYKYLILTEHVPQGDFKPNKDIISGQGIRLKKQSGINLLLAPFNLLVIEEKQLLSTALEFGKGKLVTTLYRLN